MIFLYYQKMEIKIGILATLLLILLRVILFLISIIILMAENGLIRIRKKFVKLRIVKYREEMSLYHIILIK